MGDWKSHLADMQRSRKRSTSHNAQQVWLRGYGPPRRTSTPTRRPCAASTRRAAEAARSVSPGPYCPGHGSGRRTGLVRRPGCPSFPGELLRGRPGDHRRRRDRHDHRGRRGEGPGRRGARGVPDPGQPAVADPAADRGADRDHQRDGGRGAAAAPGAAGLPGVRPGMRRRGSQRAVRHRLPAPRLRRAGVRVPPLAGGRHGEPGPADPAARRGAQLPAGDPGPPLPRRHHAEPPRAGRRPGHRGRAARADRAGRQPRRPHPGGPAGVQPAGVAAAPGQAHLGGGAARPARGLPVRGRARTAAARALRRQVQEHPDPGPQLLHRRREARPGSTRWCGWRPGSRPSRA